ncbi:hypothetical protein GGH12_000371 [Coemansia sp. RSA 1822]|nr:hypothetical protein IW147_001562 [Coemansia sp. RSA 720]KAJ2567259.1 hypothetical protein GGH12_000371 [Coemansia sp. RSA 1822]
MADNEQLKRQIQQLERAINQRRHQLPSSRFNPLRPPVRFNRLAMRASRNMKLTNQETSSDSSSAGYVSYGNKLVRVGSGLSSIRPQLRPRPSARPVHRMQTHGPRQVVIDGETFMRKGRGNKLVRASSIPTATTSRQQQRIVDIDGENYVRTKKGSLVRFGALQALNKRRQRPPVRRKRLCTKNLFEKCEQSADECCYSHELSPECPEWVEKGKCLRKKCRLPHPTKNSKPDQMPTKEEEEKFMKQYIQRPIFDREDEGDTQREMEESESDSADKKEDDVDDDLSDDLSDDEADELLKWYDDNYVEDAATVALPE